MSYHIQLSAAQIAAICEALEQAPPRPNPVHDTHVQDEINTLVDMFKETLTLPENDGVLHGFTL